MRRLPWPGALAAACLLVACGAGGIGTTSGGGQASSRPATSSGSTTAAGTTASGVACLPVDTPVDQAPSAIANVWRARDVMIVPACSVFDVKLPAFVNLARSAGLTDAEARRIAEARIRSEQMGNWGLRTGQLSIADSLSAISLYTTPALDAVRAGYSVTSVPNAPGCATPIKLTAVGLSPETLAGMDKSDPSTAPGAFGLVVQYGPGHCTEVGTKYGARTMVVPDDPTAVEYVLAGLVRHDQEVGIDYWYFIANGQCGSAPVVAQTCQLAGY